MIATSVVNNIEPKLTPSSNAYLITLKLSTTPKSSILPKHSKYIN